MYGLTENQIRVLRWVAQGRKPSEICEIEKMAESSVYEAIRRGRRRIDYAIELLSFAISNEMIDEEGQRKLTRVLSKI